ncbi:MAG: mannose-1-phosphate guanylyltransferase [Gemmatimonadetes bacterium]|nr:mannose-1-phosphate guanylyltransferase [Gemmatimonadota bacterium]
MTRRWRRGRTTSSPSPSAPGSSSRASRRSSLRADADLWILVLAGGIGSRFWPVSTRERPKQLLPLARARPLIADTVERARSLVADDRIRILAGEHLASPFRAAISDLPASSFLVEPRARGTCPVLAWAAWEVARHDPQAVLVSLHSDHLIRPLEAFVETVRGAAHVARSRELLVTVGIRPDRVETGYGHIQPGGALDAPAGLSAFRVAAFHEKPDSETARRYLDAGYLWNSGIFVWKASVFLDEVRRHAPDVAACLPLLEQEGPDAFFGAVPVSVVDTAVMEKSDRVACVRATFAWDDVGSWEALARTREADASGNVLVGEAGAVQSRGNVVFAEDGRVVLFGVDDLVVVRSSGVTLVLPRSRAADLKSLLRELGEAT